jgi:ferrous iron transport protein B
MSELALPARVALVGNPNSGKTALFNALTGSRQKVANYPGVTGERKEGLAVTPAGLTVRLIDLSYAGDWVTRLIRRRGEPAIL